MNVKIFISLGLLLIVTSCASVALNARAYSRLADAVNGKAHLYFYRLNAYPLLRTPSVLVDGELVFDPPENAYTVITLPVGSHKVQIDWSWDTGWPDLEFSINLDESKPLYLKITGSYKPCIILNRLGSKVVSIQQEIAENEIKKCCRYIAPHPLQQQVRL